MVKKGAIQLSVNFVVTLILAIVVLLLGVSFVKYFFIEASVTSENLDRQTIDQLENLMAAGKQVAIPFSAKTIRSGSVGVFALGILNNLGETKTFQIDVSFSKAYDNDNEEIIPSSDPDEWVVPKTRQESIGNNKDRKFPIAIKAPKETLKGTYIFNVQVSYLEGPDNVPYGESSSGIYKIYADIS